MSKWGVKEWDTNYPRGARLEGFNQSLEDRKVILTYVKNGKKVRLEMANQNRAVDNLRVLYLAIDAMRLNDARGIGETIAEAYKQLAAPEGYIPIVDPFELLGIREDADIEIAEAAYRTLAKSFHPDQGGSVERMEQLNQAIAKIREAKNG